ncbi:Spy/CpxP family protein refolding chaperone [Pseudomonas sp. 6D_7.1_Bac1]|uniref:Spy/CpxP family protein refolding chaperone n=1 Tax=Pseudomonas sp. 6D_7.1_Bac1 TaxID=2971615 RepID=UPI0021CA29E3|nr:Spy/CpxP family protein refolding chaperone [Pseudomonas sp. 6D_7.1_Bac1]MCU1749110.1 Spy/CpxP family protein refolding chaperone [Pseudomonas sp. 6D_7.1_Bac1]
MKNFVLKAAMPAALMLALLTTPVSAQTTAASSSGTPSQPAASHTKKHVDVVEKRIKELHAKLKITDKQSAQWDAYAQTIRDNANNADKAFLERAEKLPSFTAEDAMASYARLAQLHADNMQKLATTFSALYGSFSDDQKKNADKLFRYEQDKREDRHEAAKKSN